MWELILQKLTGIVTFGNRTYYFETPYYTQDAYVNPVQISFHGVVFTPHIKWDQINLNFVIQRLY